MPNNKGKVIVNFLWSSPDMVVEFKAIEFVKRALLSFKFKIADEDPIDVDVHVKSIRITDGKLAESFSMKSFGESLMIFWESQGKELLSAWEKIAKEAEEKLSDPKKVTKVSSEKESEE